METKVSSATKEVIISTSLPTRLIGERSSQLRRWRWRSRGRAALQGRVEYHKKDWALAPAWGFDFPVQPPSLGRLGSLSANLA